MKETLNDVKDETNNAIGTDDEKACCCDGGICNCLGKAVVSGATSAVDEIVTGTKNATLIIISVFCWPIILPLNLVATCCLSSLNYKQKKSLSEFPLIKMYQDIDPKEKYKAPCNFFCGSLKKEHASETGCITRSHINCCGVEEEDFPTENINETTSLRIKH